MYTHSYTHQHEIGPFYEGRFTSARSPEYEPTPPLLDAGGHARVPSTPQHTKMSTLNWSERLRGICPDCNDAMCLTTKAKLWGHSCNGVMKHGALPYPDSVETWGDYNDRPRKSPMQPRRLIRATGAEVPSDELKAWLEGAISVVQELAEGEISVEIPDVRLDSLDCLNCGSPVAVEQAFPLYCTKHCQLVAESVRYHRRVLANGRYASDPYVRDAVEIRLQKLSQGIVVRKHKVPAEIRARVFARADDTCEVPTCSNPATDLDHVEGREIGRAHV